jgi:hypothetical protein
MAYCAWEKNRYQIDKLHQKGVDINQISCMGVLDAVVHLFQHLTNQSHGLSA